MQRSRCSKGQPLYGLTYGKRQGHTNVIGAWSSKSKLFATQTYSHTVNKKIFVDWINCHLLQHLKPGMAVIMDNAPWHKGHDIKELIQSTGAKLIKLPLPCGAFCGLTPCHWHDGSLNSPDLNPIEQAWANLKHYVKPGKHLFQSVSENIRYQLFSMNLYSSASAGKLC